MPPHQRSPRPASIRPANRWPGARRRRHAAALGALAGLLALAACLETRHATRAPDGTGLYVEIAGEGPRTVVVPLAARFAPYLIPPPVEGVRVVLYDPRARGQSDFPRFADFPRLGLWEDVEDVHVVLRQRALDRVVLVGWWYTAAVAAHYAARHPERVEALILIAPLPIRRYPHVTDADRAIARRPGAEELAALELRARGTEGDTAAFCRELQAATLRVLLHDPALAEEADAEYCRLPNERPARLGGLMGDVFDGLGDWDWRDSLAALPVPTLVVHGASDPTPLASSEEWADTLPRGRLTVIEGMGRMPWLEAGDELNAAIGRFVREVAPR